MGKMATDSYTYKSGDHGEPLAADVYWSRETLSSPTDPKPIALILHGGGFTLGSKSIVPPSQITYLTQLNFVVVIPNYRLCPQVTALEGPYADTLSAYLWCKTELPSLLRNVHNFPVDESRITAMGYSAGGLLALWLATQPDPPKAIASFYPSLYLSDLSTTAHQPYSGFAAMPDFQDTTENHNAVFNLTNGEQLSAFPMAIPGQPPKPRHIWFMSHLKRGNWISAVQPDGNFRAMDPCVLFAEKGASWPPTIFVQGDKDDLPGSSLEYVERAINDLKTSGASKIELMRVEGESHMFDTSPDAAIGQPTRKAEAVKSALDFLAENV
ncbi:MAG: hypothetical protein Q9182_006584 [Xanthomendoza sp. 2 TL-2023]